MDVPVAMRYILGKDPGDAGNNTGDPVIIREISEQTRMTSTALRHPRGKGRQHLRTSTNVRGSTLSLLFRVQMVKDFQNGWYNTQLHNSELIISFKK